MLRRRAVVLVIAAVTLAACGTEAPQQTAQRSVPAASSVPPASASASASAWPANLPPLPQVPFAAARPMPIVESVFRFAAEHPEVLSKMPCFCGCENRGHQHNDDCFVAGRDDSGRVTKWEPHGIG